MTEFELYLVKPGQDRVMLDLAKRLSDYSTIKDHVSQFIVSQLVQLCTTFLYTKYYCIKVCGMSAA